MRFATNSIAASGLFVLAAAGMVSNSGPWEARAQPAQPVPLAQAIPGARLLGAARLTVFGLAIYDAGLWAPPGFQATDFAQSPLALELSYLRDFEGKAIAERSIKEMRGQASFSQEQAAAWLATLQAAIPDVRKGDRILGLYDPQGTVRLFYNGRPSGELRDAELARSFMGIWLSPKTSEPAMRLRLLGEAAP